MQTHVPQGPRRLRDQEALLTNLHAAPLIHSLALDPTSWLLPQGLQSPWISNLKQSSTNTPWLRRQTSSVSTFLSEVVSLSVRSPVKCRSRITHITLLDSKTSLLFKLYGTCKSPGDLAKMETFLPPPKSSKADFRWASKSAFLTNTPAISEQK